MKSHGRLRPGLDPLGDALQPRTRMRPVVERSLQRAGNMTHLGAAGQVFRDHDELAVAGGIFQRREFHGVVFPMRC